MKRLNKIKNKRVLKFTKLLKENGDLYASIKPKEISKIILDELKMENWTFRNYNQKVDKIGQFEINIILH